MRYTTSEKLEIIRLVEQSHLPTRQTLDRLGIPRRSSFANGVEKDLVAVRNAFISPWSNGQTAGQITRLKLVRRQTYGRGQLDLLEARFIGAP